MRMSTEDRIRQYQHIKNALEMAGYKLSDVDRAFNLPKASTSRCLYEPNEATEKAIARALGVHPKTLWKERYDQKTGQRLTPQPPENYERLPSVRQRRKGADQSTEEALT